MNRPDSREYVDNLKAPMPLARKLRLVARNTWRRFETRSDCCGHPGEPGC